MKIKDDLPKVVDSEQEALLKSVLEDIAILSDFSIDYEFRKKVMQRIKTNALKLK